jgi:hypothetical protein
MLEAFGFPAFGATLDGYGRTEPDGHIALRFSGDDLLISA